MSLSIAIWLVIIIYYHYGYGLLLLLYKNHYYYHYQPRMNFSSSTLAIRKCCLLNGFVWEWYPPLTVILIGKFIGKYHIGGYPILRQTHIFHHITRIYRYSMLYPIRNWLMMMMMMFIRSPRNCFWVTMALGAPQKVIVCAKPLQELMSQEFWRIIIYSSGNETWLAGKSTISPSMISPFISIVMMDDRRVSLIHCSLTFRTGAP